MLPVRTRFPLVTEVGRIRPGARLLVLSSVLSELDRLGARGVPGARAAAAFAKTFPVVPTGSRGDPAIVEEAVRRHAWVVTADRALAERLRRAGVSVLVPRDRHRLELHRARSPTPGTETSAVTE
jgi:rRNA-processing protein FCF1